LFASALLKYQPLKGVMAALWRLTVASLFAVMKLLEIKWFHLSLRTTGFAFAHLAKRKIIKRNHVVRFMTQHRR